MQGARRKLLAGAGLSTHQHRRHAPRDLANTLLDGPHGRRVTDQPLERTACVSTAFSGLRGPAVARPRRPRGGRALDGRRHHGTKLLQVYRFGQVVECTRLQSLHRVLGRPVGRHHDAALGSLLSLQAPQQLEPKAVGQPHVRDDGVELPRVEQAACFGQVGGSLHPVALTQQGEFVQCAQIGLVVNDQHMGRSGVSGHQEPIVANDGAAACSAVSARKATKNSLPGVGTSCRCRSARW